MGYNNDGKKFFQNDSDSKSSGSNSENEKDKLTLKKYNMKFVEQGGKFDEDDDDTEKNVNKKTYIEEQEELKKAFHDSDDSDSDENELLSKKVKTDDVKKAEHDQFLEWVKGKSDKKPDTITGEDFDTLRETWKNDDNLDKDEKFLRDYFANEAWLDKNEEESDDDDSENSDSDSGDDFLTKKSETNNNNDKRHLKLDDSEEDELFVQKQEKAAYEQMLNQHIENEAKYRHPEVGSDKLQSV